MLIHRIWKEEKRRLGIVIETRFKEGWFLLGFIPIYTRTIKLES